MVLTQPNLDSLFKNKFTLCFHIHFSYFTTIIYDSIIYITCGSVVVCYFSHYEFCFACDFVWQLFKILENITLYQ